MRKSIDDFIAEGGFKVPAGSGVVWEDVADFFEPLAGKVVLISLRVRHGNEVVDYRQIRGTLLRIDAQLGVEVTLANGQTFWLPGDPEAFEVAEPGEYHLRGSGEVVMNPDILTVWSVDLA